jgi:Lipopolysaccharide kinase (Kdo/WaaP) family
VPAGYEQLEIGGTLVVAQRDRVGAVRAALRSGTLYAYAAAHKEARPLAGRGVAYAAPLPDGAAVVVRHNRHGGLLASFTGDLFLSPTRAPYELGVALRLASAGVPTPTIVAYAVYRAGPLLRRSDVASVEIPESTDLAAVLTRGSDADRRAALDATAMLLGELARCGARHHDLNVKNVLLAHSAAGNPHPLTAYVLDVDRVEFGAPGDISITERNLERFARSVRKWRDRHGARVDEADLARVAASARAAASKDAESAARATTRS